MDKLIKIGVAVLAVIIVVSFFLPWIAVEAPVIGGLTKVLTGKAQASISAVSGYDVPVLANGPDSRFMISVIQIFKPGIKDADKKSYLIWGGMLLTALLALLSVDGELALIYTLRAVVSITLLMALMYYTDRRKKQGEAPDGTT